MLIKRLATQSSGQDPSNSSLAAGGDASFSIEQQGERVTAVVDPEMKFINLAIPGDNGNLKLLPTKIKLINQDNSMLEASRSFNDGEMVDLRPQSLIYGDKQPGLKRYSVTSFSSKDANPQASISPPSRQKRLRPL